MKSHTTKSQKFLNLVFSCFFTVGVIFLVGILFFSSTTEVDAAVSTISGYVRVRGTNAPIPNVWVSMTRKDGLKRYEKTDSNGRFRFRGWQALSDDERAARLNVSIDTDLNGANDAIWYPAVPPEYIHPHHFDCGQSPFAFTVVKPYNWTGTFDVFGGTTDPCVFCMNNGEPSTSIPDLFYNPPDTARTPTITQTPTPTITPTPTPYCVLSINGASTIQEGTSANYTAQISSATGPVSRVNFSVTSGPGNNTPLTDITSPYSTVLTATGQGVIQLRATAVIYGVNACTRNRNITATDVDAWWQAKGGAVIVNESIVSRIPLSCNPAANCSPYLISYNTNSFPGTAVYTGNLTINPGGSGVSSTYDWEARGAKFAGNINSLMQRFIQKFPTEPSISSTFDLSGLTTGGKANGQYFVYMYDGALNGDTLNLTGSVDLGNRKVVLLVKGADIVIQGSIKLQDGLGFFLLGTDRDILVSPSVGGPNENPPLPDLEGIYIAGNQFKTGAGSTQLHVRGSVTGFGLPGGNDGVVLERKLPDNSFAPSELFEYGPDQILMFPSFLSNPSIDWNEVAS